jgi:putative sigma-54 modulation protein
MTNATDISPDDKILAQGVHVTLTDAMRATIHEKCARLLKRNRHIVRIHVRIHRDQTTGNDHHYTATGRIEIGGPDLVASVEGKDFYGLVDGLVETLDELLRRRHERRIDRRTDLRSADVAAAAVFKATG